MPRPYEVERVEAKLFGHGQQVGFVGLKETEHRREQRRFGCAAPQLVSPDSGQFDEALRPTL